MSTTQGTFRAVPTRMADAPAGSDAVMADAPAAGGDTGAGSTPAAPTAPTAPAQQQPRQPPAGPARAPTQQELLEVHRRARELIALMRERSAGGKSKSGRYKAHDTARKHVLDAIVS